ncbi:MAG: S41 family peptidase [Planctomycetota bacterium]
MTISQTARRWLFVLALSAPAALGQINPDGPSISPFRGMRQVQQGIEVQVLDNTWFELQSVAGVDTKTLLRDAKRLARKGDDWKRITEDLPALLTAMDVDWQRNVDVVVRDLASGKLRTFEDVEMTGANRRRVKNQSRDRRPGRSTPIEASAVRADLARLQTLLSERFAYRDLRGVDVATEIDNAAKALVGDAVAPESFVAEVDAVLRKFGDGHSRLVGARGPRNKHWLPFLVQAVDGGHAAFHGDRSGLLDREHPFVLAIDGVPIERWLAASQTFATLGSATMQAKDSERGLRKLSMLRRELGLADSPAVVVQLGAGKAGSTKRELELPVARKGARYGAWPRQETGLLADGNVGYLRIASMTDSPEFLDHLDQSMVEFRETKGIVIDVRGNGGGSRDILRRLAPYFLPADGTPVVGNAAAYLLDPDKAASPEDLASRFLYGADWQGWQGRERTAIGKFLKGFRPSWKLPVGKFSPWYFLVLDRRNNPNAYRYEGKVVVLIDRACFSATDIFAGAMQAIPGVTLMGESTGGGSGRAQRYRLPNSGVRLQLSTMASFRPDGTLFEGNGVTPDTAVAMQPGDLVGSSDTVLDAALAHILP